MFEPYDTDECIYFRRMVKRIIWTRRIVRAVIIATLMEIGIWMEITSRPAPQSVTIIFGIFCAIILTPLCSILFTLMFEVNLIGPGRDYEDEVARKLKKKIARRNRHS